jgi:Bifunctional DNA primase/polymerase, N-terminal
MHYECNRSTPFLHVNSTSPKLQRALALAKLGFRVHPLEAGTKKPHLTGYKDLATTDEAQLRLWWARWPDANPGIICGQGSGSLVLDIDRRNGGEESLVALERAYSELPLTWLSITRDGFQAYFRQPKDCIVKYGQLASGIELLGEGRNVVGVGSARAADEDHAEHIYEWADCQRPTDIPMADLPQWVMDLARRKGLVQTVASTKVSSQTSGTNQVEIKTHPSPSDKETATTGGVFLLTGCSTPLLEMNEIPAKIDKAYIKQLFSDWRVAQQCIAIYGLHVPAPSKKFWCVVHPEKKTQSAALMKAHDGEYRYSDLHHKVREGEDSPPTYSLTSVYFAKRTGRPLTTRLDAPSYVTWSLRLLVEAGVLPPCVIKAPKLRGETSFYECVVYEGFQQLLATKWIYEKAPTPFTWEFASAWCNISEENVGMAMSALLSKGYIRGTGDFANKAALFTLGTRSLINRRARRLKAQAKHQMPQPTKQAEIFANVQPDIDAMLKANEAPSRAWPDMTIADKWIHCQHCGTPYDENYLTFTCTSCGFSPEERASPVCT